MTALIVLAVVIAVNQLEGNFLEPVVLGRTLHLHPLAVLLALTAGTILSGIVGAPWRGRWSARGTRPTTARRGPGAACPAAASGKTVVTAAERAGSAGAARGTRAVRSTPLPRLGR